MVARAVARAVAKVLQVVARWLLGCFGDCSVVAAKINVFISLCGLYVL